jgi:hypothetical protein
MPSNLPTLGAGLVPEEPIHLKSAEVFEPVSEMLDGQLRTPAVGKAGVSGGDGLLEEIAADLYRIASMLLGEGEDAVGLIERFVADADLPAGGNPGGARHAAHLLLAADAISILGRRGSGNQPASLAAPGDGSGPAGCIEDDDLEAAGVTPDELEQMISGPEGHRLRDWLEGLPVPLRVIFVLRAVAGLSSAEISGLLTGNGGPAAKDWTPEAVRSSFRQALCSLASQLIHATATK